MKRFLRYHYVMILCLMTGFILSTVSARTECPDGALICIVERVWTERELTGQIKLPPADSTLR